MSWATKKSGVHQPTSASNKNARDLGHESKKIPIFVTHDEEFSCGNLSTSGEIRCYGGFLKWWYPQITILMGCSLINHPASGHPHHCGTPLIAIWKYHRPCLEGWHQLRMSVPWSVYLFLLHAQDLGLHAICLGVGIQRAISKKKLMVDHGRCLKQSSDGRL